MSRQGTINKKLGSLDGTNLAGVVPLPWCAATGPLDKVPAAPGTLCWRGPWSSSALTDAIPERVRAVHGVHREGPAWR